MSDQSAGGGERDYSGIGGRLKQAARNVLGTQEQSEVLITIKAEMQGVSESVAGLTKEFKGLSDALQNISRNTEVALTGMQKFREAMPRFTEAMRAVGVGVGGAQAYAQRYSPTGALGQGFASMEQALTPFMVAGRGVNGGQFSGLENQMNQMGRMGYGSFGTQDMAQAMATVNQRMGLGGMSTMFGEQGAAAITARLTGSSLAEGAQGAAGMYGAQTINSLARFGVMVQPGGQRRPFQEIAIEAIKAAAPRKAVTKETLELAHPGTSFYESLSYVLGGDQTLVDQVLAVGRANWTLTGGVSRAAGFSDRQIDEIMGGTTTSMARDFGQAEGRRQAEEYGAGGRENVRQYYGVQRAMEDFKTDLAGLTQQFGPLLMTTGLVTGAFSGVVGAASSLAGHLMAMKAMTATAGTATPGGVNPTAPGVGMTMGKGGLAAMIGAVALPIVGNAIANLAFPDDPNKQMLIKKGTSMAGGALGGAQMGFMIGGPWGAAAGGLIGGLGGLLMGGGGGGDPQPSSIGGPVSGAHQQQNASASGALMAAGTGVNAQTAKAFLQTVNTSSYGASAINGLQPGFAIQLYKLIKKYPHLGCGSGFRSEAQQRELYEGRRCDIPGNCCKCGRACGCKHAATAKPGNSWHEKGVAMDLTPHPNPGLSDAQFAEFGLYRPMSHENWHVQPTHIKSGGRGSFDADEQAAMLALSGGTMDVGAGDTGLGGALGSGGSSGGAGSMFDSGRNEGGGPMGGGGGGAGGLSYNEVSATLGAVGSASASGSAMLSVNNGGGGALAPGGDAGAGVGPVGPPGADYGKQLTGATAAKYARAAGFSGSDLVTAVAVMNAESHFKADAHNPNAGTGDNSYGLFQINMLDRPGNMMGEARRKQYGLANNDQLFDPTTNAKIAYDFYKGMGFSPWSTYKRGEHQQWMDEARQYVQQAGVGDAMASSIAGPISHHHTWNVNIGQASIGEVERMITEMESRAMTRTGQRPETRR